MTKTLLAALLAVAVLLPCMFRAQQQERSFPTVPHNGYEALLASRKAFENRQYNLANFYADKALHDTLTARQAAEIKISCMKELMKSKADSAQYLVALLQLHDMAPRNKLFLKQLIEFFTLPGHEQEMRQFATDEIRKDSTNRLGWVLKGETFMRSGKWDEAIGHFRQAVAIDSSFVEAIYNIGICHCSKGVELKDSFLTGKKRLSAQEKKLVSEEFMQAKKALERVRSLDPRWAVVDWRKALYQIYYVLRENDKAREVKALLEQR